MDNKAEFEALGKDLKSNMDMLMKMKDEFVPQSFPKKIRLRVGLFKHQANVYLAKNNIVRIEFLDPKKGKDFFDSLK